ncbi:MAG: hypothetical protein U0031_01400 [Thermomicrobiales bacterium]
MDSFRFDRLCLRVAGKRLSRRRAVQTLGAAGLAGAALGLGHQQASADCADIRVCYGRACPAENQGFCDTIFTAPIPGGPVGMCWSWDSWTCNPCNGQSWADLTARCNMISGCYGQCKPGTG